MSELIWKEPVYSIEDLWNIENPEDGEARKLIEQGAVSLDDNRLTDPNYEFMVEKEAVLKVGKRRFLKLKPA